MKYIIQLFWLFFFSFVGEALTYVIPISIPGSVIGMILLFIALHYGWLSFASVEDVGNFLTGKMGIFFVPAGVGLIQNFDILGEIWWQLLIIATVSLLVMMGFVGKVVQIIIKHTGDASTKKEANEDD